MTAWSANVCTSSIWALRERVWFGASERKNADNLDFARQGDRQQRAVATQSLPLAEVIFAVGENVGKMCDLSGERRPARARMRFAAMRILQNVPHEFGGTAELHRHPIHLAVAQENHALRRVAQSARGFDQGRQHGLQVESRATDHLQHVGCRGLLLQRVGEIARACLHLVEQPHVLDRDHRLIGEGLQEFDLSLVERTRLGASDHQSALDPVVAQQRHADDGTIARERVHGNREFAVGERVANVFRLAGEQDSRRQGRPARDRRVLGHISPDRGVPALGHRPISEDVPIANADRPARAADQRHCGSHQRIEHSLQIERRAADDFQHVGGRGLLLQGLLRFVEEPDIVDGDDGLIGESLEQFDLPVCERARLFARDVDGADRLAVAKHRHRQRAPKPRIDEWCRRIFRVGGEIGDMRHGAVEDRSTRHDAPMRRSGKNLARGRQLFRREIMTGHVMDEPVLEPEHPSVRAFAEVDGALRDRVEHRLHVGRRARYHAQDFGGRRLSFERLGQVLGSRLHLVEQPGVLERDDGLIGECLHEFDLALSEWAWFGAVDHQYAFDPVVSQ
jgi:hypothetical protein